NDLSPRERREYLAWLKASDRHVEALLDIYRYHGYGRKAKLNVRTAPSEELGDNVVPFTPRGVTVVHHQPEQPRRRGRILTIAAMLAGVAFTVVIGWTVKVAYFDQRIDTDIGEWGRTMLADGS